MKWIDIHVLSGTKWFGRKNNVIKRRTLPIAANHCIDPQPARARAATSLHHRQRLLSRGPAWECVVISAKHVFEMEMMDLSTYTERVYFECLTPCVLQQNTRRTDRLVQDIGAHSLQLLGKLPYFNTSQTSSDQKRNQGTNSFHFRLWLLQNKQQLCQHSSSQRQPRLLHLTLSHTSPFYIICINYVMSPNEWKERIIQWYRWTELATRHKNLITAHGNTNFHSITLKINHYLANLAVHSFAVWSNFARSDFISAAMSGIRGLSWLGQRSKLRMANKI